MHKISKKQRKLLRSVWRIGTARNRRVHSHRISNAMERGCRRKR